MASIEFRLLGPFEVVRGGEQLDVGGRKQRAVLAALALAANRVVSLDRLIDELWGEDPPPRATGTLQAYVSNLRRLLEPQRPPGQRARVLVTQAPGYMLVVDPKDIDAARFEAAATEGRRLLEQGRPAAARARLDEALSLWRGPALADFADEDFVRAEAARLEELRLVATEDRVQAALDQGDHAGVVAELETLVAAHPLRERQWGLLMIALYRSERQADALRAYEVARTILGEELGIEPGPALRRLEADIRAHASALDWRPPQRPGVAVEPLSPGVVPAVPANDAPQLVGRRRELDTLGAVLQRAFHGRGAVVLIQGEAGIGKSRLAQELTTMAGEAGAAVGWGGSVEGGGTPAYRPWVEVLRSLLAVVEAEEARVALGKKAAELSQLVPEVKSLAGAEQPAVIDPETARVRLFEAVAAFLAGLAHCRPVVAVLDDLQWADIPSLELLGFLAPRLRDAPLVVVGAYRGAEVPFGHPLRDTLAILSRHQVVERLELHGLEETDVGTLIAATLGAPAAPDFVAGVLARTEGNPFFVTELARLLAVEGAVSGSLGRAVPARVQDVVRHRMSRLPEQTRALLSLAAVAGREFDLAALEVAGGLGPERTIELMEAALMTGVVVEHPQTVGRFRFSHDLVRETILEGLSVLRRSRLHARLAAALMEVYPGDDSHAVELAHHLYRAVPVTGAERAIPAMLRAAEVAGAGLAHEQAEDELRRAEELVARLPAGSARDTIHLDILLHLNSVLAVTKGFGHPAIGEVLHEARTLSARLGASEQVVRALFGLMLFHLVAGRYDAARAAASQLLETARQSVLPADMVAAHLAVGITAVQQGDLTAAGHHLEEAYHLREGLHDTRLVRWFPMHPVICASCFLAWAVWELGDRQRALQLVDEALAFAGNLGHNVSIAHALDAATRIAVMDGNAALALERSERALHLRGKTSTPLYDAIHAVHHGWARAMLGESEQGIAELQAGLEGMEKTGAWMLHTLFLALLAEAQRLAGKPKQALGSIERAFGFVERIGEHFWESELHRLRGELLQELEPDQPAAARQEMERALTIARQRGAASLECRAAESLRRLG